jgi:tetratricopeptide (TPR) repeat protein
VAFNRERALAAAAKHTASGKHASAAREYQAIVEADPSDIKSWVMLAECLARAGDEAGAIERYLKIAEFYAQNEEPTKAVAVYRQILNLDQNRLEVQLKIAGLLKDLGHVPDAIATYEFVAQAYFQAGRIAEGLEGFRMVAELDSAAVAKRLRLAELYSREGRKVEAVEHFRLAAHRLLGDRRFEDFIRVAERLLYHKEDDVQILRDLAEIYLHQKEHRRALIKLNGLLRLAPADAGGLELLADTFVALGKQDKAVSVALELAREQRKHDLTGKERAARVLKKALGWSPEKPAEIKKMLVEIEADLAELRKGEPDIEVAEVVEEEMDLELDVDIEEEDYGPSISEEEEMDVEVGEDGFDASLSDAEKLLIEVRVLLRYKMFEHAQQQISALLGLDPQHRGALNARVEALVGLGRLREAAEIHVRLAQLIGDSDAGLAQQHIQGALELVPGHPTAMMVLTALEALGRGPGEATPLPRKIGEMTPPPRKVGEMTPPPRKVGEMTPPPRKVGEMTPPPRKVGEMTPPPRKVGEMTPPPSRVEDASTAVTTDDSGLLRFSAPKRRPPLPPNQAAGRGGSEPTIGARGEARGRSRGGPPGRTEPGSGDSEGESGPRSLTNSAATEEADPQESSTPSAVRPLALSPPRRDDAEDEDEDEVADDIEREPDAPAKPPPPRLSFLSKSAPRSPRDGLPRAGDSRPVSGPVLLGLGRMPSRSDRVTSATHTRAGDAAATSASNAASASPAEPAASTGGVSEATTVAEHVAEDAPISALARPHATSDAAEDVTADDAATSAGEAAESAAADAAMAAADEAAEDTRTSAGEAAERAAADAAQAAADEAAEDTRTSAGEAAERAAVDAAQAAADEAAEDTRTSAGEAAERAAVDAAQAAADEAAEDTRTSAGEAAERAAADAAQAAEAESSPEGAVEEPAPTEAQIVAESLYDELAELRFYIDQGFEEDAYAAYLELDRRFPGHPALREFAERFAGVDSEEASPVHLAEPEPEPEPVAKPSEVFFEEEDDDDGFFAAIFDDAPVARPKPKSTSAPRARAAIGQADPRTHFDLGTAYREMGLIDDALAQFAIAAEDADWRARSLVMTASLHLHRGAIPEAIGVLEEAVRCAVNDDERSEARYELGVIYQVMGEVDKAIAALDAVKSGYRDRDARLADLHGS